MGSIDELKLFGMWCSPYVRRVEWALALKGIQYEYIEEDLSNKSHALLQYNPVTKLVPVLLHNGKAIAESMVIIEYIDETWKHNPILPKDPRQRAVARFWAGYVEKEILGAVKEAFFMSGDEQRKAVENAIKAMKTLDHELMGKRMFGGDIIGFADLVAGWIPHWLGVIEEVLDVKILDAKELPYVAAWMEKILEEPAIKDNLPPRASMLDFYGMLHQIGIEQCDHK